MSIKTESLPFCEGCTYLSERLQRSFTSDLSFMFPFCTYYELHFNSVHQIDDINNGCPHYNEGYI